MTKERMLKLEEILGEENHRVDLEKGKIYGSRNGRQKIAEREIGRRKNIGGYFYIDLSKDKKHYTYRVHEIIAFAGGLNPLNPLTVNHKNGTKTDNRIDNLEVVTRSENTLHAYKMGLKRPVFKITPEEVTVIKDILRLGLDTQAGLAKKFGVLQQQISRIKQGKSRVKHCDIK